MRDKRELSESDINIHTWGFEWDDIGEAAKEMRRDVFGPDKDRSDSERFCFNCGEIHMVVDKKWLQFCPYCGNNYATSRRSKEHLAYVIDEVWELWSENQRVSFKRMIKRLRSISPEFRQMWERNANQAAMDRRFSNG
jgi:hypothetical protein